MKTEIKLKEGETMPNALRITDERADQLIRLVGDVMRKGAVVSEMLKEIFLSCNNNEEVVFASYVIGANVGRTFNSFFESVANQK